MTQQSLFDPAAGRRARDEALDAVDEAASAEWRKEAMRAGEQAARELPGIISDDVAERMSPDVSTRDLRALGPVMIALGKAGFTTPTENFKPARKKTSHRTPRRIWQSLIYMGQGWLV